MFKEILLALSLLIIFSHKFAFAADPCKVKAQVEQKPDGQISIPVTISKMEGVDETTISWARGAPFGFEVFFSNDPWDSGSGTKIIEGCGWFDKNGEPYFTSLDDKNPWGKSPSYELTKNSFKLDSFIKDEPRGVFHIYAGKAYNWIIDDLTVNVNLFHDGLLSIKDTCKQKDSCRECFTSAMAGSARQSCLENYCSELSNGLRGDWLCVDFSNYTCGGLYTKDYVWCGQDLAFSKDPNENLPSFVGNQRILKPKLCPDGESIATALGCIPTEPQKLLEKFLPYLMGLAGGIAFLMMLLAAFEILTSAGNPEKVKHGKERLTSAIIGLLFVIFSTFILRIIGLPIMNISK